MISPIEKEIKEIRFMISKGQHDDALRMTTALLAAFPNDYQLQELFNTLTNKRTSLKNYSLVYGSLIFGLMMCAGSALLVFRIILDYTKRGTNSTLEAQVVGTGYVHRTLIGYLSWSVGLGLVGIAFLYFFFCGRDD